MSNVYTDHSEAFILKIVRVNGRPVIDKELDGVLKWPKGKMGGTAWIKPRPCCRNAYSDGVFCSLYKFERLRAKLGGTFMKNETMMTQKVNKDSQKDQQHLPGNIVKTTFQKNQENAPFQGYNYFGTKPKWD